MIDLDIQEIFFLKGPNIWANFPVFEAWVSLGHLKDTSSDIVPGFSEKIKRWLPTMIEHRCSKQTRGGFFQRLDIGTWPAHILEHVTLELQTLVGHKVGFGKTVGTDVEGLYKVVVEYLDEEVGKSCLHIAREILLAAYAGREYNVAAAIAGIQAVVAQNSLDASTQAIVEAARRRRIPWRKMHEKCSLIQLGQGIHQRRIWGAESDRTRAISAYIANDEELKTSYLLRAGLPVRKSLLVGSPEEAWEAAARISLPVVVKPRSHRGSKDLFMPLKEREQIEKSYLKAAERGCGVIVSQYISGDEYRAIIIGGKLISAYLNPSGENINNEIPQVNISDRIHPRNIMHLTLAAQVADLDICGIDLICEDLAIPLEDQGGAIVGLKVNPELIPLQNFPAIKVQPFGKAIIDMIYPPGTDSRVPLFAITGTSGKTMAVQLIAHLLRGTGKYISCCTSDGLQFGQRYTKKKNGKHLTGTQQVLMHPSTEIAVCESSFEMILKNGLDFDFCDVVVLLNAFTKDLGLGYTMEEKAKVYPCILDAVSTNGTAVLNADDELIVCAANYCYGHVLYFSKDSKHPLIVEQAGNGGRSLFVSDNAIHLAEGCNTRQLCLISDLTFSTTNEPTWFMDSLLGAIGAAWAYGLDDSIIVKGLKTFVNNAQECAC